jgi:uncharacterized protein YmfQ (DUF2313 family)
MVRLRLFGSHIFFYRVTAKAALPFAYSIAIANAIAMGVSKQIEMNRVERYCFACSGVLQAPSNMWYVIIDSDNARRTSLRAASCVLPLLPVVFNFSEALREVGLIVGVLGRRQGK